MRTKVKRCRKFDVRDKKMSKLDQCPHIFWINLEKSTERKEYMEQVLNEHHLKHTRISAYDGENQKDFCIVNTGKKEEIGCLCSHLKALETFLTTLDEYALICEDDLSFEYVPYWQKTFWEYIKSAPRDFSIIQLSLTYAYQYMKQHKIETYHHQIMKHEPFMYGAVCYLITRNAATLLLQKVKKQEYKYDLRTLDVPISDCFMYNTDGVYTIPLFTTNTSFTSTIHNEHIDLIHIPSKKIITDIWKNKI